MQIQFKLFTTLFILGLTFLVLVGCKKHIEKHGNSPNPKLVAAIKPGIHKHFHVERLLGSPSTTATFDREHWYYIHSNVQTFSFRKPKLLKRRVLIIEFDNNGVVANIRKINTTNQKEIDFVKRKTPTKGKELTFIQQAIGNIGKFRKPSQD
tara:strand:+ start:1762 stop:2217 length:456 start_codon:yes stop_codon:yes gene_type:complete